MGIAEKLADTDTLYAWLSGSDVHLNLYLFQEIAGSIQLFPYWFELGMYCRFTIISDNDGACDVALKSSLTARFLHA